MPKRTRKPRIEPPIIKEAHFKDDWTHVAFERHPAFAILAAGLAEFFREEGGPNFVSVQMYNTEQRRAYRVLVAPSDRPLPSELIAKMRKALESIYEHPEGAKAVAAWALSQANYPEVINYEKELEGGDHVY